MRGYTTLEQNVKNEICIKFRRDIKALTLPADTTYILAILRLQVSCTGLQNYTMGASLIYSVSESGFFRSNMRPSDLVVLCKD